LLRLGILNPNAFEKESTKAYYLKQNTALREKFAGNPEIYGKAKLQEFDPAAPVLGKPGSMDVVLTFRNVHNWRMSKQAEGMFKAFYAVLKKGGTLGVVEHRANKDVAEDDKSGYVSELQVIALTKNAGFVLDGRSELNRTDIRRGLKVYGRAMTLLLIALVLLSLVF